MSDNFPVIKAFVANMQAHTYNSLDLIETLVRLGDSNSTEVAQCIREHGMVHMGLLQVAVCDYLTHYNTDMYI